MLSQLSHVARGRLKLRLIISCCNTEELATQHCNCCCATPRLSECPDFLLRMMLSNVFVSDCLYLALREGGNGWKRMETRRKREAWQKGCLLLTDGSESFRVNPFCFLYLCNVQRALVSRIRLPFLHENSVIVSTLGHVQVPNSLSKLCGCHMLRQGWLKFCQTQLAKLWRILRGTGGVS